jgi:hypothetical protein
MERVGRVVVVGMAEDGRVLTSEIGFGDVL